MEQIEEKVFHDVIILNGLHTKEEVIKKMSDYLLEKGYINEKYYKATIEREKKFPTGLSTEPIGTALPHSDAENVLKAAVLLGVLDNTVEFTDMGNSENKLDVGIVFLMALKGENNQINYLRNIANFSKNKSNVMKIYNETDKEEIRKIFKKDILNKSL